MTETINLFDDSVRTKQGVSLLYFLVYLGFRTYGNPTVAYLEVTKMYIFVSIKNCVKP